MAMAAGPDEWNHVDMAHLDGDIAAKTTAVKMKEQLIHSQEDRVIVKNEIYIGSTVVKEGLITTSGRLEVFCEDILEELNATHKIIFLETWGDTNRWEQKRRDIDGNDFYKNEESCGVVGICIRVRPMKRRPHHGPDLFAYIHIGKIIENEWNNQPTIPDKLKAIFTHPKALFVGENVSRHIMRVENSFFTRLDGVKYLGLSDLVNRFERSKVEEWERFFIDPFRSNGILNNFHKVFPEETFFKNPYECVADWDTCATMRESQLVYALTNVWAESAIFDEVVKHMEENKMQLAIMFTLFPRLVESERSDQIHLRSRRGGCPPLPWYNEREWPKGDMSRHPACIFGSGDPTEIRRLQKAEWEAFYGSVPEDRRLLKRRRLDGPVRQSDQVDEHRVDDEAEEKEKEEMISFTKKIAPGLHSEMPDADLEFALKLGKGDEVLLLVGLMEAVTMRKLLKRILVLFAGRWPSDRKTRLIETLVADGYFERRKEIGMLTTIRYINLARPHPRIFLLFKTKDRAPAEYFDSLDNSSRREVMYFLSRFLEAKVEDRMLQLQSCPFFRKDIMKSCVLQDEEILELIGRLCKETEEEPSPAYFRKMRPAFVTSLIEKGENGTVSVENAVKQAVAFAGEDWRDKCDMVSALGKWQTVANEVKKQTNAWSHPPQFYHVAKNLLQTPECRLVLHANQTSKKVRIIESAGTIDWLRRDTTDELSFVHIVHNKNPRSLTETPSVIAFKMPKSGVFAFFPQEARGDMCKAVLSFLAEAKIVTRMVRALRVCLAKHGVSARILDLAGAMLKAGGGRTPESFAEWTWGSRFCPIAREEWVSWPLTAAQEKHMAYFMDLLEQTTFKIGLEKLSTVKC